ncbi:uncharacterized protein EAE98_001632 [Botrytis deweyae]|uniref:SPX domain-containing protein n=1 Tax=Botrytis deweyae TaxID=2478750 RepID=A0ABQ7IYM0_9HELO|nr:uncharacterized protein EAE98_001632 [Botrytis deweyae]KAF7937318.1 hypothetical protein EAE98_001632 [Botrytis deweyae]
MAHTISANQDGADGTSAIKKDFYDDSTPQDLLDKGDYVSLYLRCRYDRRGDIETGQLGDFEAGLPDDFRKGLPKKYELKIKQELDRIAELRAVFVGKQRNVTDIEKLKELKVAWKINAITSYEANSKDNALWITKLKNDQAKLKREFGAFRNAPTKAAQVRKDLLEKGQEILGAQNKDRILKEVEKWSPPGDSIPEVKKDVLDNSGYGFSVSKITLKKGQSENSAKITSFDQYQMERYSVSDVLEPNGDEDPWAKENTESIRYFHFPANNMKWIEKAIQRHYKESKDHRPQTSKVLSRELWVGQQHGALNDPLHSRHMRSHCKFIPQDTEMDAILAEYHYAPRKSSNNNMVLFMPYLHWEMDRKRAHMTKIAKELTSEYQAKQPRHHILNKNKLAGIVESTRKKYAFLEQPEVKEHTSLDGPAPSSESKRITGFSRFFRTSSKSGSNQNVPGKVTNPCGCYLMQAAKVYEAMDLEPDIKLLRSHLHETPPLHPRRTLDQSYYFKLENTDSRDKDQVVSRGTNERRKINGSTRVVMVDQLWMYILDEYTIITSFPRRLGRNKPDSSGVHKCIRDRLEKIRPGQINSVYDLALLILNECSTVFFDRTKPTDKRPEVLDIFSNAIGYVSEMKTNAFELFWGHVEQLSGHKLKISPEKARLYHNINPEGVLLREAHDIIEELKMISRINLQQLQVTQVFSKALQTMNGQVEPMQEIAGLLSLMLKELQKKNPTDSNGITSDSPAKDTPKNFNKVILKHTINRSLDLVETISNHQSELQQLEDSAREISEQLRDLLTLKQQQASIIEATASLDLADESVHQGRSIMIFTIITIIFLPLSFMSSIFGMNAVEFTGSSNSVMGIGEQFEFMFPISIALTLFFLCLALKAPRPILTIFPFFLFFPIVFFKAAWYGYRKKPEKWQQLSRYLLVGSAKEKLGERYREMVTNVYRRCSASNAKDTIESQPKNSDNKEQVTPNDESRVFYLCGDRFKNSAPAIGENNV